MKKKVLILDDNTDILEILTILLIEVGYEIKCLAAADRIFEEIKEFKPDLILLDVMLTNMDGLAICKDIKENILTSFLPVILMSGKQDLADYLHIEGGPDDYLAKPFDIDILLSKVEEHLRA
jgi:DNA-binding response OmpR family regulator